MLFDNQAEKDDLERTLKAAVALIDAMMPGVAHIPIQDYEALNRVPLNLGKWRNHANGAPVATRPLPIGERKITLMETLGGFTLADLFDPTNPPSAGVYIAKPTPEGFEALPAGAIEHVGGHLVLFTHDDTVSLLVGQKLGEHLAKFIKAAP